MGRFEELVAEGEAVPTAGWDFSWFAGRATEERPAWGYSGLLGRAMARARAGLDLQTGGGEVLAGVPQPPPVLAATEGWAPNVPLARGRLAPLGGVVAQAAHDADLPFPDGSFDLVTARHPVLVRWDEVRRVLRPGGRYLAQHVGPGSVRELTDYLMDPAPAGPPRREGRRMEVHDVAAVVHFLRKVVWIVPGFTADAHLGRLRQLHAFMEGHGPFVAHSQRFLLTAERPAGGADRLP
jgi:SAM-dependent methyltransferase